MEDANRRRDLACPLNGAACIDGVRDDFANGPEGRKLRCRWWQHLYGKDPQADKTIDQWDCAVAWLPITTIEGAQMSRQTAASVDKVANQVADVKQGLAALSGAVRVAASHISQAVESGALTVLLPSPDRGNAENGNEKKESSG